MTAEIPVTASAAEPPPCSGMPTGNVLPLLHEIRHAVKQWLASGEAHAIDLRSIPMAPGEEDRLLEQLGEGEVRARLSVMGLSEVIETGYPGVWLVTHYNADEVVAGRFIEICAAPDILKSQTDDIRAGLQDLEETLSNAETTA